MLLNPIEITLRFSSPQEVLTLIETLGMALDEAHECIEDYQDAQSAADLEELWEAIWKCLQAQGFSRSKDDDYKLRYQGELVEYKREKKVEAVPDKEVVKRWMRVHETT